MIIGKHGMRCGLIAEHLGHSFSPQIHKELADYSYDLIELQAKDVSAFLQSDKYDAFNVTIPYKKTVIPYLGELSETAKKLGSVNTVKRLPNGMLFGDNTDYYGFQYLIRKNRINIQGKKVLVLGTGGASVTVCAVCRDMGACEVSTVSRTGELNYDNVYSLKAGTDIVVNTTPVGMYPNNGNVPIELEKFNRLDAVIDIIYNPRSTALLQSAQKLGINHANGLVMLVAQAKRASEIFLDTKIDDREIDKIERKIASQTSNIILVGMPGCGKSSIGKAVAEKLSRTFLDTDEQIVKNVNKDIPAIFADEGEKNFRKYEHEAVCELGRMSGAVISTGGGAVTTPQNHAPLSQNGMIFFIKRDIEMLSRDGRPLSQNGDLSEMYSRRLPMYESFADHEIENDTTIDECADKIISLFSKSF